VRLGFVLDQTKCIGCHACTVACKSENDVPIGVFRTWVKYVEKGVFPDTRRHFAVLRCNQCDDAPCATICPTRALYRRPDGIVDFDSNACIGCKSCMQACPYDALYIDPSSHTAAKCNLCSHRVDRGLLPACEIVCPTQAIMSGDFDDPESPVAKIASREPVAVRKPDQGTLPKVFYVGADATLLDPRIDRDVSPMFTDPGDLKADVGPVREVYDAPHATPWGWKVWAYLWTKSIAAGVLMLAALFALTTRENPGLLPPAIALAFITITAALLVFDLKRPERFWLMLVRPNFRSWLVWGGYILGAFGAISAAWIAGELLHIEHTRAGFAIAILLGAAAAGYTAFLFNQAEGRDFWQSPKLLWHLLLEALVCGAAVLLLARCGPERALTVTFLASLALQTALIGAELVERQSNIDVRRASHAITKAPSFWAVVIVAGSLAPMGLLVARVAGGPPALALAASVLALAGALEYGRLWIVAGQKPRLS